MNLDEVIANQNNGLEIMTTYGRDYQGKSGRQKAIADRLEVYRKFLSHPESIVHRSVQELENDIEYASIATAYLSSLFVN